MISLTQQKAVAEVLEEKFGMIQQQAGVRPKSHRKAGYFSEVHWPIGPRTVIYAFARHRSRQSNRSNAAANMRLSDVAQQERRRLVAGGQEI